MRVCASGRTGKLAASRSHSLAGGSIDCCGYRLDGSDRVVQSGDLPRRWRAMWVSRPRAPRARPSEKEEGSGIAELMMAPNSPLLSLFGPDVKKTSWSLPAPPPLPAASAQSPAIERGWLLVPRNWSMNVLVLRLNALILP